MTLQEIKDELIKIGFTELDKDVVQYTNKYDFIFIINQNNTCALLIDDNDNSLGVGNPTLDRIKALIFGLTGEEM